MIVRNFTNSGSVVGAVNYVLSDFDCNRTVRSVPPKILRGDPELTKTIDQEFCQHFKHKSLSGVLSFRQGETISEQQKQELIDDYEKAMFGNMRGRVNALYVEHGDKKGNRLEIHYVINRVDMDTGKFYNPNPPGQLTKELVKTFTALKNQEYGFQAVEEKENPLKAQYTDSEIKGRKNHRNGFNELKGKVNIDRALMDLVKDGTLKNRNDLLVFLADNSIKLSRTGNDYISIEREGKNIRLRGGIYSDTGKDYQIATTDSPPKNQPTYEQNMNRLNEIVTIRNQYNSQRFAAKVKTKPALICKSANRATPNTKAAPQSDPQAAEAVTTTPPHQNNHKATASPLNEPLNDSVFVASNEDWAVPVGEGDRRYFVLDCSPRYKGQNEKGQFFHQYNEWLGNGGREAIFYLLKNRDISQFNPRVSPKTAGRVQLLIKGLNPSLKFIYELLNGSIELDDKTQKIVDGKTRWFRKSLYQALLNWLSTQKIKETPTADDFGKHISKAMSFDIDNPKWKTNWKTREDYFYEIPSKKIAMERFANTIADASPEIVFFAYSEQT